jgi:EpsI family protein
LRLPGLHDVPQAHSPSRRVLPLINRAVPVASLVLIAFGGAGLWTLAGRQEIIPERARFASFPTAIEGWRGRSSALEPQIEHVLGLDDYILADFVQPNGKPINFYVAYYPSQRKGVAPHSPIVCIPGGGWQITRLERVAFGEGSGACRINRVVIERGQHRQIVYYWFEQRGRRVANEWLAKWYLIRDAITVNRTDAALVRLSSVQFPGETEADVDRRLKSFIPAISPTLEAYLPSMHARSAISAASRPGRNPT